jgi:hypothetical protein
MNLQARAPKHTQSKYKQMIDTFFEDERSIGFMLAAILVIASPFMYTYANNVQESANKVVSTSSVGKALDVVYLDGNSITVSPKSQVKTQQGIYLVEGLFSVTFTHDITLERRGDNSLMLCDRQVNQCLPLVQSKF